jgi:hypothetical protein
MALSFFGWSGTRSGTIFANAVSITTIHHALSLIATLLAWFSIAGLLFVALFLFQGERGAATAQKSRREQ